MKAQQVIYKEITPLIPIPLNVEVMGMKPCSLNDMLHIIKEPKYIILPTLELYYLMY